MKEELLKYRSVAVVGTAKNVGKTVTMNHLLSELRDSGRVLGLTSVGYDGEGLDQVTETAKPEITLYEGMVFTTAEQQYAGRRLTAEILEISGRRTSVGRPVTARVKVQGKCIISGPADTWSLKNLINRYSQLGVDLTLVDGAQSRMSLASPTVTDAMVLATGAALSANMQQVVMATRYACQLIEIGECSDEMKRVFGQCGKGVWTLSDDGVVTLTDIKTALSGNIPETSGVKAVYVTGAVGDRFVERLKMQNRPIQLVVADFTKLFLSQAVYAQLLRSKVHISVMYKSRLVAVTANPWSPQGFTMDSRELCDRLSDATGVNVYDVMKL